MLPLIDKISGIKKVQFMCGLNRTLYWLVLYAISMIMYTVVAIISVLSVAVQVQKDCKSYIFLLVVTVIS